MTKSKIVKLLCIPVISLCIVLFIAGINQLNADFGKDFQTNGTTLIKYGGTDSSVLVPDGITVIDSNCFSNNPLIESVVIPESVTKINDNAFSDCVNLTSVSLPDSITEIGKSAFSGCNNLQNINFGEKVAIIGSGIFANCTSLYDVDISEANPYFICDNGVIYKKDKSILYTYLAGKKAEIFDMPNEVSSIDRYAFWGNNSLKYVNTSTALKEINDYAFFNLPNLESVTINKPVTKINIGAFQSCPKLSQVILPETVINIFPSSFSSNNITFICDSNSYAYKFATENNYKTSTNPVLMSFEDKKELVSEELEEQIESEDSLNIDTNIQIADEYVRSLGNSTIVSDKAFIILDDLTVNNGTSSVENTVKDAIYDYEFYNNNDLNSFTFDNLQDITKIGKLAFARTPLLNISIPDSVEIIGYGAFYHCDSLNDVLIPESVKKVDAYAFDHTPYMDNFLASENQFLIVGDGVLIRYNGDDEIVVIPDNVKYISTYAFKDNDIIQQVILDKALIRIYDYAFSNCSNLDTVDNLSMDCVTKNSFSGCLYQINE